VRTVEAATTARACGLRSIGVTYDPESRLAAAAETTLAYRYEDPGFGPGTISYVASLGALYALALRAAQLAGRDAALEAIDGLSEASAQTIELAAPIAERLGRETPFETKIDVVGGGPSLGTALFGRAKLVEAARAAGGAHELEEWARPWEVAGSSPSPTAFYVLLVWTRAGQETSRRRPTSSHKASPTQAAPATTSRWRTRSTVWPIWRQRGTRWRSRSTSTARA
jgi:hypothetical protein